MIAIVDVIVMEIKDRRIKFGCNKKLKAVVPIEIGRKISQIRFGTSLFFRSKAEAIDKKVKDKRN